MLVAVGANLFRAYRLPERDMVSKLIPGTHKASQAAAAGYVLPFHITPPVLYM